MSEITYARQFLALLDSRPVKLESDYVVDPRQLPPNPAYILPRMPRPLSKRVQSHAAAASSGADSKATENALTITLKPLRPTPSIPSPLSLSIPAARVPVTSVYDLKVLTAPLTGYAPDKIKILWDRKPVSDSKTVADLAGPLETLAALEMGVMFVGQPSSVPSAPDAPSFAKSATGPANDLAMHDAKDETPVVQGASGTVVLETKEFWDDLQAFVLQRTRDEGVAAASVRAFREAWRTGKVR